MHVILADDHRLFRDGLCGLLKKKFDITKVYEADDVGGILEYLELPVHFALILLDYSMPGMDGLETVRRLVEASGRPVVVISGISDRSLIRDLLRCGVVGFIPKTSRSEVMMGALQLVLSGGVYIPDMLLADDGLEAQDKAPLTERQRNILGQIGEGRSNREIAELFGVSEHTVRVHVAALMKRYGASNRTRLAVLARADLIQ